jgi:hypothetical protein
MSDLGRVLAPAMPVRFVPQPDSCISARKAYSITSANTRKQPGFKVEAVRHQCSDPDRVTVPSPTKRLLQLYRHIASFRCVAEFGRYRGMADMAGLAAAQPGREGPTTADLLSHPQHSFSERSTPLNEALWKPSKHDRQYLGIVSWAVLIFHIDRARHKREFDGGNDVGRLHDSQFS